MKKSFFIVLFLFVNTVNVFAQTYFNKLYSEFNTLLAESVVEVKDGFILSGNIFPDSIRETSLIKTNFKGDTIWQKIYGKAPKAFLGSSSIIKNNDGNVIIAGWIIDSVASVGGFETPADVILTKVDAQTGDSIWSKRYYDIREDDARDIIKTKDGGFAMIGATLSYNTSGYPDFFLIKTDSLGNEQWRKIYGGTKDDQAFSISQTIDGGYIFSGWSNSFSTTGDYDTYVVRTDSEGKLMWQKTYGDKKDDFAGLVQSLHDGNYLLCTNFPDINNKKIATILKINDSGGIIWQQQYPFGNYTSFHAKPIENADASITAVGSMYYTTTSKELGWLLKLNGTNGDTIWTRSYTPRIDYGVSVYDMKSTTDGGFIFCGSALDSNNKQRAWVVKTDCMGADSTHYYFPNESKCCGLFAAQVISNTGQMAFCKGGSITLSVTPTYGGYLWSTGENTQSITVSDSGHYAVTITDTAGCYLHHVPIYVQADTMPVPVITATNGTLTSNYVTGNQWYKDGVFILNAIAQNYKTQGVGGDYTVKVTNMCGNATSMPITLTSITNNSPGNSIIISIYPNPVTTGILTIECDKPIENIRFYNLAGQLLLQTKNVSTIDVNGFPKGFYILVLVSEQTKIIRKIVIE